MIGYSYTGSFVPPTPQQVVFKHTYVIKKYKVKFPLYLPTNGSQHHFFPKIRCNCAGILIKSVSIQKYVLFVFHKS